MSYTVKIKEEISTIESTKSELIAELSGYLRNNGIIHRNKVTMTTENKFLVERIKESLQTLYNKECQIEIISNVNFSKKSLYQVTIDKEDHNIFQTNPSVCH